MSEQESRDNAAVDAVRQKYGFGFSWLVLMIALPPLVYYLWICVTYYQGELVFTSDAAAWRRFWSHVAPPTWHAAGLYAAWFLGQAALQVWAPGPTVQGMKLPDGSRLDYRMNGIFSFLFTLAVVFGLVTMGWLDATVLYDQLGPLLTVVNIFTFVFAGFLYFWGLNGKQWERPTGRPFYDYFMGTALNPRIGSLDLKLFCEARPGMIFWLLMNLSMAAKQYELHGTVTVPMLLVVGFQSFYLIDYFIHEEAVLTTWDIKHEKFGWMLCWGDLVWLPFTYTLQAQYLVHHTHDLPVWGIIAIVALNLAGYAIFRGANIQKHHFRRDPNRIVWGKPAKYIKTKQGSLLLTSGWWGIARHMNYFGDLMIALSWCLPAAFGSPIPYFHIVYFTILLLHREKRDDAMCLAKYGEDWLQYRKKVPWRIVPKIY
ncbi:delta(14)-sterol reductase [Methylotuvimicrobium alcaliphilum]|uniref:Delta(14)-sterol reductase n=1 Tax=Methylotuvimicrobium alcaliphilum (strain DSM 19304 / NCIMB 14124 / VKM B-2133 / 20Z) TaxID=1091494 RepID=ERG_META2|nr:delta(14)-sterol reductase [Methylotuvimicrobium alcaliphilum]G4SW86.1 RecName: Full=Delta(14)-sterol reductase; AltName: Full=C-14 sterol reductase; Short=C14SR; AltName: Full=MaSR1; AltName: Full=Sterol C14-reductase [Methylotuvimicrobium alcaliphilum 20Z]4QUV_A Chain A, Delta(14)-sterol reductase [Methylotuvimicrobium alcaliphilum 20Z]4QUV_B Chain B, Delta(14)-sterol reductase [Methylotuvimicrobium alcaliphilum 20Z]CCE23001.1 delta(14)-sterol reductase [Methylotuvimicrobium alcaliphilum 2